MADTLNMNNPTLLSALEQMKKCNEKIKQLENSRDISQSGTPYEGQKYTKEHWQRELNLYKGSIGTNFTMDQIVSLQEAMRNYKIDASTMTNLYNDKNNVQLLTNLLERDKIKTEINKEEKRKAECQKTYDSNNKLKNTAQNNLDSYQNKLNKIERKLVQNRDDYDDLQSVLDNDIYSDYKNFTKEQLEEKLEEMNKNIFTSDAAERKKIADYLQTMSEISKLDESYKKMIGNVDTTVDDIRKIDAKNAEMKNSSKAKITEWNMYNTAYNYAKNKLNSGSTENNQALNAQLNSIIQVGYFRTLYYQLGANKNALDAMEKKGIFISDVAVRELAEVGVLPNNISFEYNKELYEKYNNGNSSSTYFYTDTEKIIKKILDDVKQGKSYTLPKPEEYDAHTLSSLKFLIDQQKIKINSFDNIAKDASECLEDCKKQIEKLTKDLTQKNKDIDVVEKKKTAEEERKIREEQKKLNNANDEAGKNQTAVTFAPYAIKSLGTVFDIESTRYSQTPYGNRVGYTLLSCGDYVMNTYNNGFNKYGDNITNSITFVLPLPDGTVSVDTKANWNDTEENGLNEFAATMNLGGASKGDLNPVTSGVSKWGLNKVLDLTKEYGLEGAWRGAGVAYNPNTQMYFKDVSLSSFDYTFSMTPKSKEEAAKVKLMAEAINLLMLPGTTKNGSNINALDQIKSVLSDPNWSSAWDNLQKFELGSAISNVARGAASFIASGLSGFFNKFGDLNGLSSPFFSYPGLWTVGIYVIREDNSDFPILEVNRLAMTSCKLDMGGSNGVTWHPDGYPTVMELSLDFTETQYRTKENMFKQLRMLGNPDTSEAKDVIQRMNEANEIQKQELSTGNGVQYHANNSMVSYYIDENIKQLNQAKADGNLTDKDLQKLDTLNKLKNNIVLQGDLALYYNRQIAIPGNDNITYNNVIQDYINGKITIGD